MKAPRTNNGATARLMCLAVVICTFDAALCLAESPIDPDEKRPQLTYEQAEHGVGRTSFVYGKIQQVSNARGITFLNFDLKRREVFKIVVFERNYASFPGQLRDLYEGKTVRVRGIVSRYAGIPQIEATSPEQITILNALPELPPAVVAKPRAEPAEVTLATFNIKNLFDDLDAAERNDESTPAKPRPELEAAAACLRRLDADLVALQEVENREYLARFVEVFLDDLGYQHIVHYEGNDTRGSDVALLSRLPIGQVTSHRHLRFQDEQNRPCQFSRDLLAVCVEPSQGEPFEVWVLHLKSNADGRETAEPIRLAEAQQVRRLLDNRLEKDPATQVVVCGDFNDQETSRAVKAVVGSGSGQLQSDWVQIPAEQRITFNREPYRSMIDFVLWTPAMARRYVPNSYAIIPGSPEETGSDHNPVLIRLRPR